MADEEKRGHDDHGHEHERDETPSVRAGTAHPAHVVTEKAAEGMVRGFWHGIKKSLDEAFFLASGAVGGYLASYFAGRGQKEKAEAYEKARQFHIEGKHEAAREIIIQADIFGIGYGDEAGTFFATLWAIQFLLDSKEAKKIEPFLDALDALDKETKDRLIRVMAKIGSVEESGKVLVKLARTPGELKQQVRKLARIAGIEQDPKNHPANVLVTEVGEAFSGAFKGYAGKVKTGKVKIRRQSAKRETQRLAAKRRIKNRRRRFFNRLKFWK